MWFQIYLNYNTLQYLIELADDLIQQLESYESKFKAEYKANVDFKYYKALIESSRQQSTQYEEFLNLFSTSRTRPEKSTS